MIQHLKLSELMSALSYALDITEGQPEGHCVRCCWIGMNIGKALGLREEKHHVSHRGAALRGFMDQWALRHKA